MLELRPPGSVRGCSATGIPTAIAHEDPGARNRHTGADLPALGGGRLFGVPILH